MALRADAVPPPGLKGRGINNVGSHCAGGMSRPRAVAAFAADARLCEWRRFESVLGASDLAYAGGVALKAGGRDAASQERIVIRVIAGRRRPFRRGRVICRRGLIEKPVHRYEITARG